VSPHPSTSLRAGFLAQKAREKWGLAGLGPRNLRFRQPEIRRRAKRAILSPQTARAIRAARPDPSADKMRPPQDDRRKNRGAEAPRSEVTEALFHLDRIRKTEKSCPWGEKN